MKKVCIVSKSFKHMCQDTSDLCGQNKITARPFKFKIPDSDWILELFVAAMHFALQFPEDRILFAVN